MLGLLLLPPPIPDKGGAPVVGASVPQLHEIPVQLIDGLALLAVPAALAEQPAGEGQLVVI